MITIINYGMGNLMSVSNMLKKIGYESIITSEVSDIKKASKLILPGVGAFGNGMKMIDSLGIRTVLNELVLDKKVPCLGICLGMQLMCNGSEEGDAKGLGWIDADFIKFRQEKAAYKITIPNIGWREVELKKETNLVKAVPNLLKRYYFVHSYHAVCQNPSDVLMNTEYGYEYAAAFEKENIIGVQFHPEKSHKFGFELLKNFVEKY